MEVRAVLVLPTQDVSAETANTFIPTAPLADVLGLPVVFRVLDDLKRHDISSAEIVTDVPSAKWPLGSANRSKWTHVGSDRIWRASEQICADFAQGRTDVIVLVRLGPYTNINYSRLLQQHITGRHHVTCAVDSEGAPLDVYAISGSRRNDAAFLIRHHLREFRSGCGFFVHDGYVNHLASPRDLRRLAIDALMQRIHMPPEGEQIKPGVWLGRGAQIHRRARVLSPAYIGAASRVRASAIVTRCSALENHTVVDCGTVVEDVSTLPYTYLGAGLDVCHSVVGHRRIWDLKRNVEVEFCDDRLIGETSANALVRGAGSLATLIGFLPAQLLRGIFAPSHREKSPALPQSIQAPSPSLDASAASFQAQAPSVDTGEFPANLVVARRYGNE